MPLKDRVILVTNVEKFAGHGTTEVALAQGATVLAHDPTFQEPSVRRKYESHYPGAHALSAVEPEAVVELALKRHGHIDALVNNDAFPALRAPLAEARMEDFRAALEAMAVKPLRLTQLVATSMRQRKSGRIVFVSSAAPLRGIANYAPYVAARRGQRAGRLARQGAGARRHHGQCRRLQLRREPGLFPAAAAGQCRGDGQDDGADPAWPARHIGRAGRSGLLPLLRLRRLHHRSPASACGRMGVTRRREHATMPAIERRARLTEARLPGGNVKTRR